MTMAPKSGPIDVAFQGEPRYTDGTPMVVDRARAIGDKDKVRRLRSALEKIIDLPDECVYLQARGIALRALLETE